MLKRHRSSTPCGPEFMLAQLTSWVANTGFRTAEKPTYLHETSHPSQWGKKVKAKASASKAHPYDKETPSQGNLRRTTRHTRSSCQGDQLPEDSITIDIAGLVDVKAMLRRSRHSGRGACDPQSSPRGRAAIEKAAHRRVRSDKRRNRWNTTSRRTEGRHHREDDSRKQTRWNITAIVQPGKMTRHVARWVEYGHRAVTGGRSYLIKAGRKAGKDNRPRSPYWRSQTTPIHPASL